MASNATSNNNESSGSVKRKEIESDLPFWERVAILAVWCAGAFYMCYSVAIFSIERFPHLDNYYFEPGWLFNNSWKDTTNFEWEYWRDWNKRSWMWYIGHILIGQLLRFKFYEHRWIVQWLYSLTVLLVFLGWKTTLVMYGQITIMYIVASSGSLVAVWIAAMLLLSLLNIDSALDIMRQISLQDENWEKNFLLFVFAISMTNLRYISFCSEWCEYRKKPESERKEKMHFSLLAMYHYCTYLPTCFTGPVCTYYHFYKQFWQPVRPWNRQAVTAIINQAVRVAISYLICEFILHTLYFCAIHYHDYEVANMPAWPLGGSGYLQGQFFMVKYVVLFGVPRILCLLDQITLAGTPSCISRIGSSVNYWRTFDRGLYQFMIRHMYVPLGGSKNGILRQFVASTMCFIFVFLWHGATDNLFYWVLGNYIDILLETFAWAMYCTPRAQEFERKYLSPANSRRLKGALKTPSFLMTCVSVFTFLGGMEVGRTFMREFVFEFHPTRLLVSFVLGYTLVQTDYIVTVYEKNRALEKLHKD